MPVRTPCLPREVAEASLGAVGARHEGMRRAPADAPVRVSTSRSIKRAAAKASISRTRSVSARFSISSTSAILSSVIVVSWFRFKRRNSNPNRRPAVTAPGVRCAQQGFAHALSGPVLHHASGHERLHGPYTGQMKAVLHQTVPNVPVIDLFADAPVGNPKAAAYLLAAYAGWFPAGTIFLCVVDPGVVPSGRWLECEGGVISGLFSKP